MLLNMFYAFNTPVMQIKPRSEGYLIFIYVYLPAKLEVFR